MARETQYPSNNAAVPNKKENRYQAVIPEGHAVIKEKSIKQRILSVIIPDNPAELRDKLIFDYLIPNVKKGIVNGLNYVFFGEIYSSRRDSGRRNGRISYERMWDDRERRYDDRRRDERREERRDLRSYENIRFEDYAEANDVLENMKDTIERYSKIDIAAIYEFAHLTSLQRSTDFNYGWYSLAGASVEGNSEDGYYIYIPRRPQPLD